MGQKRQENGRERKGEQVKIFWRGGRAFAEGGFWEGAKRNCQERKKGFFFFWRGPEARGELEMGGFGRWKT